MIGIVLNLVQVFITLFFLFLDNSDITASCQNILGLALLASPIQMKIFFRRWTQSLTQLIFISIFTLIINNRKIMILLSFGVFLISIFLVLQWFIATDTVCVIFSLQQRSLASYLSFNIHSLFNDHLSIVQVVVFFI